MATATRRPTPTAVATVRVRAERAPSETASTSSPSTFSAGSAKATTKPSHSPKGTRSPGRGPDASAVPMSSPTGRKPMFTPWRNSTVPAKVNAKPTTARRTRPGGKGPVMGRSRMVAAAMGMMAVSTSRASSPMPAK